MGIFHTSLESKVEEESLKDILRKPFRSAWGEIFKDLNYEELFSGSKKRKSRLNDLAILGSFGISSIPHELIHAGTNILTGGKNEEIVINRLYGGDLVHLIYPGIQSKWLLPIIGGYVKASEYGSKLAELAVSIAPYAMTPIGICLIAEGKKRKSLALAVAGSGMLVSHAGGIIGDFFNFGRTALYEMSNYVVHTYGHPNFEVSESWLQYPLAIGGFILGWQALSMSYRLFKAGVNYVRNIFKKDPL